MADNKEASEASPLVVVFAGPNGSGKTSLIEELKQTGLATMRGVVALPTHFINPDQVAKDLKGDFPDQNARDEAAQRAAMQARATAIAGRLPFAFETVMSHPSRISEMLLLKEQGYHLFLTFITTDDPEKTLSGSHTVTKPAVRPVTMCNPKKCANATTGRWRCCRARQKSPMRSMSTTIASTTKAQRCKW